MARHVAARILRLGAIWRRGNASQRLVTICRARMQPPQSCADFAMRYRGRAPSNRMWRPSASNSIAWPHCAQTHRRKSRIRPNSRPRISSIMAQYLGLCSAPSRRITAGAALVCRRGIGALLAELRPEGKYRGRRNRLGVNASLASQARRPARASLGVAENRANRPASSPRQRRAIMKPGWPPGSSRIASRFLA